MKTLTKQQVNWIGSFDKSGRYYLNAEFETETSRQVRTPSRAWPFSVYKHVFTGKYFKSLSDAQRAQIGA